MIAIPHAECERCHALIPLLRVQSIFAPDDKPYLFLATHARVQGIESAVQCEGSMREVAS